MYFPDRGCVRPLRHLYGYATETAGLAFGGTGLFVLNVLEVLMAVVQSIEL